MVQLRITRASTPQAEVHPDSETAEVRRTDTAGGASGPVPPVPSPLSRRAALPEFPVSALPGPVAEMVAGVAEFTQTDPGMAGTSALAMLAACAGGRAEVQVRPGWNEPLNIYTATVAGPGERKSAVQATMTRPLLDAEAELAEAGREARLEAETTKAVALRAADQAKVAAGRAEGDEDKARLLTEAIAAAATAEAITVPVLPRIVADDVTPEAAASLLGEQSGRLAVISAEGGIFDVIAGRYSGNVPHLDVWLKGHAGDLLRVDRKGRPPEYIGRPALTLGLMIQPSVLAAIARQESFRGRGLLARFLFCVPPSRVGRRRTGMPPVAEATLAAWDQLVKGLALTLAEWHDPAVLLLEPDAAALIVERETVIEPQLGPEGALGHIADWGSKLTGATVRLAGLLHLARHPQDGWRRSIIVDTVAAAVTLAEYYRAHALAAFDAMQTNPVIAEAETLLRIVQRLGADSVSTRELFAAAPRSRFRTVTDMEPGLAVLVDHGYLSPIAAAERDGPGRRPSARWSVHPQAAQA